MPDREKVMAKCRKCIDTGEAAQDYQFYYDVISLLEEQEAKPVIVTTNAYGTRFYHCPKCNRDLYVYPRQLYCSNCGQAVKWTG